MARVTITIEGEAQEIRRTLRKLLGPMGMGPGPRRDRANERGGPGTHGPREPWSPEELTQVWNEITVGARRVLTEIAGRAEGYPSGELQKSLGMDGKAIGGTLSSVGVASRRFGARPPIYKFRWDEYRMPPPVAEVVHLLSQGK
ncbi:hypothetical protein [Tautonia plasticadhaerens]|uniref:Uncharacterized protein n=1 Tax=Tautonia plasticadhaerens TaxID=2527974 RepID=A0A518H946_9BACT|nr:hypothetical protein [Tautonia plasticadhaerens]QDV37377.1 hypothetical protein ElP_53150 [Tautonia plasticadhaerens]